MLLVSNVSFDQILVDLHTQAWSVHENFWPTEWVRDWRHEAASQSVQQKLTPAAIGKKINLQIDESIRGDHTAWFDEQTLTPAQAHYWQAMETLRKQLNQHFYFGVFEFECHYALYPPGSFYTKHVDRHVNTSQRVVTVITYLNEHWQSNDGGALRLYLQNTPYDIYPSAGTLVCFLSDGLYHEVLPTQRERYSMSGWFRTRAENMC